MLDLLPNPLAYSGQNEVIPAKRVDRDLLGKDGVLGTGEDGNRLDPERLALEAVRHGGRVEPPHDQVDLARYEQREQVLGAALLKPDPDVRIRCLEPGQCARKDPRGCDWEGAQR